MTRLNALKDWLGQHTDAQDIELIPASSDASFRRYYRLRDALEGYVVMDAPPEQENSQPFVDVTQRLSQGGINVPQIIQADLEQGYLLISDLGRQHYLQVLNEDNADSLYGEAIDTLLTIQGISPTGLAPYDRAQLWREMELFREWFLTTHLGLRLDAKQDQALDKTFEALCAAALEQPRVLVHRDYHSRNLMYTTQNNPGVLDYQDAMHGPLTYDLVSLLRDCYIAWPRARTEAWALSYRDKAVQARLIDPVSDTDFLRWFDLMGVQRHLKAIGIFARLNYRDGKKDYLQDIPRTLNYILETGPRYEETQALLHLLNGPQLRDALRA